MTPGVETTTGPLGQGLGNAVGMAIAEKHLAAYFNREDFSIVDHFTYVFVGDGCLMEGISHEVCSLAGTLGLGKLIVFYDDNQISIDGCTDGWFTDNTPLRFESYGWHVIPNVDGHDAKAIYAAIEQARSEANKPTLICCKTVIGKGAPEKAGTAKAHGEPLGDKEISAARAHLQWTHEPFTIPDAVYQAWDAKQKGEKAEHHWQALFTAYAKKYPELAEEFQRRMTGKLPSAWVGEAKQLVSLMNDKQETIATRKASQLCIEYLAERLPELMGGSAI